MTNVIAGSIEHDYYSQDYSRVYIHEQTIQIEFKKFFAMKINNIGAINIKKLIR